MRTRTEKRDTCLRFRTGERARGMAYTRTKRGVFPRNRERRPRARPILKARAVAIPIGMRTRGKKRDIWEGEEGRGRDMRTHSTRCLSAKAGEERARQYSKARAVAIEMGMRT